MSCSYANGGWEVRWRDSTGRQRSRRFQTEEAAREFDGALHEHKRTERFGRQEGHGRSSGVYPYTTASGTSWRYVVRRSDGSQTTKRGFASEKTARDARRRVTEQVERGELRHTRESFGEYWERWLARRKPYLEPGTWRAYEIDGRKRLLPTFEPIPLAHMGVEQVRAWFEEQAETVTAGKVAAKTVNNALGTLVVCLNAAVEDGLMAANPALRVPRLPPAHIEREYLRLHEIPLYLGSCSAVYRPLAELLIASGLRISEALALLMSDLDLEESRRDDHRVPLAQTGRNGRIDQVRPLPLGRDRAGPLAGAARPPGAPRRDGVRPQRQDARVRDASARRQTRQWPLGR